MRTRVYIAGPISRGILADNIRQATEAGVRLLKAGYAPLVPHLTCYMGGPNPEVLPHDTVAQDWYDMDLPWVAVSHAVLRLPGESVGADKEVYLANELNIPVYHNLDTLMNEVPREQTACRQLR